MPKSDLFRLFNVFIENDRVIERDLLGAGISNEEIEKYVRNGVISKLGAVYILKRDYVGRLFNYGEILISKGQLLKGLKCYDLCIRLNPNSKAKYKKFIVDINRKNYNDALDYFDLERLDFSSLDSFYLYLIGLVIDLPKNYKKFVQKYKTSYSNNKFRLPLEYKEVIKSCFNYKFNIALGLVKNISSNDENRIDKELCSNLISSCKEKFVNLDFIYYFLSVNNLDVAFELAIDYLFDNGKGKYSRLVKALMYLSHNLGDFTYKLVMDVLSNLENIEIDYKCFVSMFNEAFKSNNLENAKLLLKVLTELNKLDVCEVELSGYERSLGKLKK